MIQINKILILRKIKNTINKLVRGAEMKKEEAKKALENLKSNNDEPARNTGSKKKILS